MPFVGNYSQDDEDLKKQQESEGEQQQLSSPSSTVNSATSAGPAPAAKPAASGVYTNLQKYLEANRDQSPSAAISNRIGEQAQQAKSQLQSGVNQFNQQVSGGYTPVDKSYVDKAISNPNSLTEEERAQVIAQRNNQYKGPQDLSGVKDFNVNAGSETNEALKATENEPGQYSLLQRFVNRPGYSRGEQGLDQMLLKSTDQGQQDFANVRQQYGGVAGEYDAAQKAARDQAAAKKAEVEAGSKYANDQLTGATKGINDSVAARIQQYMQDRQNSYNQQKAALDAYSPTARMGIDPYNYLSMSANPDAVNSMTADEAARLNALQGLMEQPTQDYSQAGSYDPTKAVTFDQSGFGNAVSQADSAYRQNLYGLRNAGLSRIEAEQALRQLNRQFGLPETQIMDPWAASIFNPSQPLPSLSPTGATPGSRF